MASLDNLPADQKAVLSLVLQRGRTFDQIAQLLSIDRGAVRQRALEGFDALGPETTLEPLKRALITDYLLGQLPAPVAANVATSLASSPTERSWARVIAAEIAPLAVNGLPEIPAAASAPAAPAPAAPAVADTSAVADSSAVTGSHAGPASARGGAAVPPPAATRPSGPRSSRRGGAILLGLIVVAVVVVVIILLATGGSKKSKATPKRAETSVTSTNTAPATASATGTSTGVTPLHQINLTSPTSVKGREGAADVVRASGQLGLVVVAEGLVPNANNAYGVWLYNSNSGASHFLGFYSQKVASTGKTKGDLEAEVKLPAGATAYNELLLTLETAEKPTKPGTIALEGTFAE